MELLIWLEESRVSVAIAGSALLYPAILAAHGVGMSLVVGLNWAMGLRVLGAAPTLPLAPMARFYPVIWVGLWLNIITGVVLSVAAATRVLVDPVFYAKTVFVALGIVNMQLFKRELLQLHDSARLEGAILAVGGTVVASNIRPGIKTGRMGIMAIATLVLWSGAIVLGRLMGYTFFRFWQ